MQQKRLLFAVTLLAILLSFLVVVTPGSHAMAHITTFIETPTATPDANQILNQANTVATQADHTATEAQNTLNVLNFVLALFSVIIGILGLASGALVAYAFRVINRYRKQLDEGQAEMAKMRTAMDNTQKAVVYLGLGDRLFSQGEKEKGVELYRKVGSLLSEDAQINNILGRIYSGAGYYSDAITAFNAALSIDHNFAEAEKELGLTYRRRGDAQKGPDAETLRKADYDHAITHLKNAVVLRSDYEDALAGLGAVYRRMGDRERDAKDDMKANEYYEHARGYYEQAYNVSPSSSYALGNAASLSWYLGGKNAAYDYFILAKSAAKLRIRDRGGSSELYWDYYDMALAQLVLATVDKSETTKDEAIESYKTAIHLTPGIVQFDSVLNNLYLLQKAQERIHRLDTVISMLEAAKSK